MKLVAGATTLGELASAIGVRQEEAAIVAELQAGSEDAYAWLVRQYHQPVYSLVYRILTDPADAADITQEVFLKVFRGIRQFHGGSSLKTWIYRIAIHEASNRRRWWFRHKAREVAIDTPENDTEMTGCVREDSLPDHGESPFDSVVHGEIRARVEQELRQVPEPYRTTLVLRDLEELSYEEIAEVTGASLGTVKSRLTRGREALKQRLAKYLEEFGPALDLEGAGPAKRSRAAAAAAPQVEVTP